MIHRPASSPKMQSPQRLFRPRAPSWLPSPPVGHHWATQTCQSTRSTQAFLQPKRSTSKAWATKAQQDWPINVAINSWLLAYNASWGKLYTKAKPALWESPYFQILALNQTLRGNVHPTLIIQELQAIKCNKQYNISYQQALLVC
jgi:hypothetical protein